MALGENPAEKGSSPVPVEHQFNEARRSQFLLALIETGTIRGAAATIGVHFSTVYETAKKDPTFADAIHRARGEWEQSLVQGIATAGIRGKVITRKGGAKVEEPGDWRALAWLLEHSPATREDYAGILRQKVEMGGSPDMPPIQVEQTTSVEIGPDTMERLAAVVQVLLRAGKIRLPDPGETVIEGDAEDVT